MQAVKLGNNTQAAPSCLCPFHEVWSDWFYACTHSGVNVFERGRTLPGRSEVSQLATMPYRLQLRAVLGTSASKLTGPYNALFCEIVRILDVIPCRVLKYQVSCKTVRQTVNSAMCTKDGWSDFRNNFAENRRCLQMCKTCTSLTEFTKYLGRDSLNTCTRSA